jgi:hypothetical protein
LEKRRQSEAQQREAQNGQLEHLLRELNEKSALMNEKETQVLILSEEKANFGQTLRLAKEKVRTLQQSAD